MNFKFDYDDKKDKRSKIIKEVIIWVVEILVVIALAYGVVHFVVEKTPMVGPSMETVLNNGEEIVINKFAYRFSKPKRFDVVVFKQGGKEHSYYNIKRVIGLPGETVQIINGIVYINDEPLKEKFEVEEILNGGLAEEKITLDNGEYFCLGDNRNNSEDSRFANIGNVLKEDIVGKAWVRMKPFNFVSKITPTKDVVEEEQ